MKPPPSKKSSMKKPTISNDKNTPSKRDSVKNTPNKKQLKVEKNPKKTPKKTPNEAPEEDEDDNQSVAQNYNKDPEEYAENPIEKGQNIVVEDSHYVKPAGLETRVNSNFPDKNEWNRAKVNKPY